jgi:DNA primase
MSWRFSDKQLHKARNHIPIRQVIETLLAIPSETVEGIFRFSCPLCAGHHTAVKPETNLSRCFHCNRNFNAIDLCMIVKRMNFVESVNFLIERNGRLPLLEGKPVPPKIFIPLEPKREPLKMPVAVREILSGLIPQNLHEKPISTQKETPPISSTPDDIAELERIVHDLSQILERLKASHHLK